MKVGFLITARLKSTRLPEKLLREICGRPIFAHMLDRLKLCRRADQIIVCTSTHPQDDGLVDLALSEDVACFRGDEDDVTKRLSDAADTYDLDYILSATADCPFADPVYADKIVDAFEMTNADLIRALDLPHGAYSYGIKPSALKRVLEVKDDINTEVWGRYFTDTDLFEVYDLIVDNPLHRQPDLRMTLDYPEDLEFFKVVFDQLYQPEQVFTLDDILHFLARHPEVVALNSHCEAVYKKRFVKQSTIKLKPRHMIRRAAIVGSGSIGQRHIRNLHRLGITDIVALRSRRGYAQELDPSLEVQEVQEWEDLLAAKPDIAIVSNPTSLHLEAASRLAPYVKGLFIEKPLASSVEGVKELLDQIKINKTVSFVGYSLHFHAAIRSVKEVLESERLGAPLLFQCQVGHWLPDWHPYEDYRQSYSARKELGGGVTLTLIHEIHLANTLLGPAYRLACFFPETDLLPLNVDVIADIMLQHSGGAVSQIHLDYIQRPLHRCGVISCERGWVSYDIAKPSVIVQFEDLPAPKVIWEDSHYDRNQPYLDEISAFLGYVREGRLRHEFDAWRAAQNLAVIDAAFSYAHADRSLIVPEQVLSK